MQIIEITIAVVVAAALIGGAALFLWKKKLQASRKHKLNIKLSRLSTMQDDSTKFEIETFNEDSPARE